MVLWGRPRSLSERSALAPGAAWRTSPSGRVGGKKGVRASEKDGVLRIL